MLCNRDHGLVYMFFDRILEFDSGWWTSAEHTCSYDRGAKSQSLTRRHNTAFFSNSSESHTSERWPSRRITLPITSLTRPTGTVSRNPKGTDTLPPKGWIPSF
ncbi:hypothetical protein Q3G72_020544 [Acer saccharum]|nr:hypothetical protein Q3G72_020544 [Acer saccharum]